MNCQQVALGEASRLISPQRCNWKPQSPGNRADTTPSRKPRSRPRLPSGAFGFGKGLRSSPAAIWQIDSDMVLLIVLQILQVIFDFAFSPSNARSGDSDGLGDSPRGDPAFDGPNGNFEFFAKILDVVKLFVSILFLPLHGVSPDVSSVPSVSPLAHADSVLVVAQRSIVFVLSYKMRLCKEEFNTGFQVTQIGLVWHEINNFFM